MAEYLDFKFEIWICHEIEMDSENTLATTCIKSEPKCDSENSLVSVNIKSETNCDEDPLNIENQKWILLNFAYVLCSVIHAIIDFISR